MSFKEKILHGQFIITAEVAPPRGTSAGATIASLEPLRGYIDAFNVTDNQRSMVRMSSVAMSKLLIEAGFEPICQLTSRDRNRIALQSDILGAYALGIRNFCLMTGDHTSLGDERGAKPVFDIDSVQLIELAGKLSSGKLLNGKELDGALDITIGAVFNPFSEPWELQVIKLEKKIKLGAKFIQTQPVYDADVALKTHETISELGAVPIIGILPIRSLKMARFMKKLNPNSVPQKLIEGLERASDPYSYGWEWVMDVARAVSEFGSGVHFMLVGKTHELAAFIKTLRRSS